jgi:hypothetical protein
MIEGLSLPVRTIQRIRDSVDGATFDDVFLAVVGGALRDYLGESGDPIPAGFAAGVPAHEQDSLPGGDSGNHIGLKRLPLHPEIADPRQRLAAIAKARLEAVQASDVLGRSLVRDLAEQVPSSISSFLISNFLTGYVSSLAATVRGPDHPMYLAGAHLKAFYPLGFVMDGIGLSVNGFRYRDTLWVTIVSCRKMLPDPQRFARALSANLAILADAVEAAQPQPAASAARRSDGRRARSAGTRTTAKPKAVPGGTASHPAPARRAKAAAPTRH